MSLSPRPGFTLLDYMFEVGPGNTEVPLAGVQVVATANPGPLFVEQVDSTYAPPKTYTATSDRNGLLTLTLPIGTDTHQQNVTWAMVLTYPDGTQVTFSGQVSAAMVGLSGSLDDLITTYSWVTPSFISLPTSVLTTPGDLIVGGTAGVANRFAVGPNGDVLTSDNTQPLGLKWSPLALTNPMTNLADLIVGGPNGGSTRFAIGADGWELVPSSAQAAGIQWRSPRRLDPRTYGAIGDGSSHPLSGIFANLAAARLVYPFVQQTNNGIDWTLLEVDRCGIQKAINVALGYADGSGSPGASNYPITTVYDGVTTANSVDLTSATANWTLANVGNAVAIPGAATGGKLFRGTIASFVSSTHVTLNAAPSTSLSTTGATVIFGTQLARRTAGPAVEVKAGVYLIDIPLSITAALGITFHGAGYNTALRASVHGMPSIINIDGMGYSDIGGFALQDTATGTAGNTDPTVVEALSYQFHGATLFGTGSAGATGTRNVFDRIWINQCAFVTGFGVASTSGNEQLDQTDFYHVVVTGPEGNVPPGQNGTYWQKGVVVGDGTSGNADVLNFYTPILFKCAFGLYNNQGKGVGVFGAAYQDNGVDEYNNTNAYKITSGLRSEGAGKFFTVPGSGSVHGVIGYRDVTWAANHIDSSGRIGEFDLPGNLALSQVSIQASGATTPYIQLSPGIGQPYQRGVALLSGVVAPVPLSQFVRGSGTAAVTSLGYTRISTDSSIVGLSQDPGLALLGTTLPVVQFSGGGGSGAFAVVTANAAGVITAINAIVPGTGYTTPPTIVISSNHGSGATATCVLTGDGVGAITVTNGGTGYAGFQYSGNFLTMGLLSNSSQQSLLDVALYRRSTGLWGIEGSVAIGIDGYAANTLTVYSAIVGRYAVLDGNNLLFHRPGDTVVGVNSPGGRLNLQSPNTAGNQLLTRLVFGDQDLTAVQVTNAYLQVVYPEAATNTTPTILSASHRSTGTPVAGFGTTIQMQANSDTVIDRAQAGFSSFWVDPADATRKARVLALAYDTVQREVMRWESSGAAAMLGFLGAGATVRATIAGSRGGNAALAALLTELATKGLITDGTTV